MRICVILEGCYPYVTGGVSSWMHQYIQAMPQHEFVVWAINADPSQNGRFRYTLPDNVVEIREVSLTGNVSGGRSGRRLSFNEKELRALRALVECDRPDWEEIFHIFQDREISPTDFLASECFVDLLAEICRENTPIRLFRISFTLCGPCCCLCCA